MMLVIEIYFLIGGMMVLLTCIALLVSAQFPLLSKIYVICKLLNWSLLLVHFKTPFVYITCTQPCISSSLYSFVLDFIIFLPSLFSLHPLILMCNKSAIPTVIHNMTGYGVLICGKILVSLKVTGNDSEASMGQQHSLIVLARQFITAMLVMDTWQYFMHRYMHHNKFLYRHIHSQHHRLVVPYAFGALYNHPLEGLILDTIGGALSFLLSGMSPRASIFFFTFATIKTVDDHCGLWLPGNLFHVFFQNNTAYHDVHHQLYGSKYNFSQPFFVMWDKILGTYMPYSLEKGTNGGFEARPTKEFKDN